MKLQVPHKAAVIHAPAVRVRGSGTRRASPQTAGARRAPKSHLATNVPHQLANDERQ